MTMITNYYHFTGRFKGDYMIIKRDCFTKGRRDFFGAKTKKKSGGSERLSNLPYNHIHIGIFSHSIPEKLKYAILSHFL